MCNTQDSTLQVLTICIAPSFGGCCLGLRVWAATYPCLSAHCTVHSCCNPAVEQRILSMYVVKIRVQTTTSNVAGSSPRCSNFSWVGGLDKLQMSMQQRGNPSLYLPGVMTILKRVHRRSMVDWIEGGTDDWLRCPLEWWWHPA